MTQRDWDADRKLCDAATKGPWGHRTTQDGTDGTGEPKISVVVREGGNGSSPIAHPSWALEELGHLNLPTPEQARANGRFIAEARTGWPAALDEIRTLQGILSDMQQESTAYLQGRIDGEVVGWNKAIATICRESPETEHALIRRLSGMVQTDRGIPASTAIATAKEEAKAECERLQALLLQAAAENDHLRSQLERIECCTTDATSAQVASAALRGETLS